MTRRAGPGRTDRPLFTTPAGSATLEGTKDPDQTPRQLWRTPAGVTPLLAWRPGPSPYGSPNEARRPTPREVAYVSVGARHPSPAAPQPRSPKAPQRGADTPRPTPALTRPTAS